VRSASVASKLPELMCFSLPLSFDSTSGQSVEAHTVSNIEAILSNSENSVPSAALNQNGVTSDEAQPSSSLPVPSPSNGVPSSDDALVSSGKATGSEVNGNSKTAVSASSSLLPDTAAAPTQDAPASSLLGSSSEETVPSSISAELPSSATTAEPSQTKIESVAEPISLPAQAPISDMRTTPHSDALSSDAVAKIEQQKHQEDNAAADLPNVADILSSETLATSMDGASESTESAQQATTTGTAAALTSSQPAISPPPAPQTTSAAPLAEQPRDPAPTPAPAQPTEPQDQEMADAVMSPAAKVARERDDDDDAPAAKRVKTSGSREGSEVDFKVPGVPSASSPVPNGTSEGDRVTPLRLGHMKKIISNLKKSNASSAFRLPVDPVALNIPSYPTIVKHPMDLGTIDNKLKHNEYTSTKHFVDDFNLIVNNCVLFNGPEHAVAQSARKMQNSFNNQLASMPSASVEPPTKEHKKAFKPKHEPVRAAPPRRPSVTTASPAPVRTAKSPKAAAPTSATTQQAFAVGPDGVPLIRRDSTLQDGRPKRAIVPTKRNSEYTGGRPKKKKYELQLRFCQEVLKELTHPKHWRQNQYFVTPVDPVALNIPTYFQIIKKPMDLGTIKLKLENNAYEKAKDFEEDVRLVFKNCYKFNPETDLINTLGHELEDIFNKKWATKDDWISAREPQSAPESEGEEDDDDEEDASDEEDAEDSEDDRNNKIKLLQQQIAEMSKQMGELTQSGGKKKKKSKSPVPAKKSKSKSGKKDKQPSMFPGLAKSKDTKKKGGKSKPEKDRYVTFAEKQYISNGISMLPEKQMQEALKIIQNSVPSLANSDQNEIELDIEEVPNHALLKLLNFVRKYAGPPPDEPKAEPDTYAAPAAAGKSKKNKPMTKSEQEAQIEELKGKLGAYRGPVSPNAGM